MEKKYPIYVTQPSLPPLPEFSEYLQQIWESKFITNNGSFHQEFEQRLCNYLNVKYISVVSNGTLALLIALKALEVEGEIITSPFSFVATTHAIKWNGHTPVFCDIIEDTFSLDPEKIEKAITPKTSAILPVHVYGNPCNIEEIKEIAEKHDLKVLYDAAHCFGVKIGTESILNFGDLSTLSFHATKVFNTIEGGAIVCHTEEMKAKLDQLRNFGYDNNDDIFIAGINAKMNELQAAYGLIQLKNIKEQINKRRKVYELYWNKLFNVNGVNLLKLNQNVKYNYTYFPILIDRQEYGMSRDETYLFLRSNGIYTRKYFSPLISNLSEYKNYPSAKPENLPNATIIADQVLCLPMYENLKIEEQLRVINCLIQR